VSAQVDAGLEVAIWQGLRLLGEYKLTGTTSPIDVAGGEAKILTRDPNKLISRGASPSPLHYHQLFVSGRTLVVPNGMCGLVNE